MGMAYEQKNSNLPISIPLDCRAVGCLVPGLRTHAWRRNKERFRFEDGDHSVVMVGDQPRTDGRLAERLGLPFALVDSGVTPAGSEDFDTPVAVRAPDFVSLVQTCLATAG